MECDLWEWNEYDSKDIKNWKEFENYCAELLINNGYIDVRTTGHKDHGVDILAEKNGVKYAFQCKFRSSKTVKLSNSTVQEIFTGTALYKADVGVIISNTGLTRQAHKEASMLGVKIWSEDYLRLLSDN